MPCKRWGGRALQEKGVATPCMVEVGRALQGGLALQTAKEAVKEPLLGSEEPAELSAKTRAYFVDRAVKDAEPGELYMGEDEFVNAIAPQDEDYVSLPGTSYLASSNGSG